MRTFFAPNCGIVFSSVLIIIGLFFLFIFPSVLQFFVKREFQLSPTSQSFRHWRKNPIPLTLDFYLFNWTNPERFYKEKPKFTELGPYRFYEVREKVNMTWNNNGTISYRQSRTWRFNPEESTGTMNDSITTINGVTLTAAYMMRHSSYLTQQSANMAFGFTKQKISVTYPVQTLLFDGYSNNLMTLANKMPAALTTMSSPFDKFAWFYQRNNSYTFDGWFNVDTGARDMAHRGEVHTWNFKNHTDFYPNKCGAVAGYSGDVFPPGAARRDTTLNIFSQDLCRSIPFDYSGDQEVHDVQGYRYSAGLHVVDNGDIDPDNSCFCNGECVPSGFLNLTACRFGAPVFLSFPHFYDANPLYLKKMEGLRPVPKAHEFYITIEPTYGIPIDIAARVQVNMYLQPINHISMYKGVPRMMFPVLWCDQRATLSQELARELRLVILLPTIATVAGVSSLTVGTVLFVLILYVRAKTKKSDKEVMKASS